MRQRARWGGARVAGFRREGCATMTDVSPFRIELEVPQSWERRARVEVSAEQMEAARQGVVSGLRKKITMPGFRKGKVPLEVIQRDFAERIDQEALEQIIPAAYRQLLASHDQLRPVSDPRVENLHLHAGEPVHFDLMVEVRPEIQLQGYKGLQIERPVVAVTEQHVDSAMEQLAERNTRWLPVSRQARAGDALLISFAPLQEDGAPDESQRTNDYAMELGGDGVLPEFSSALQGLQPGEDTRVDVTYAADYPRQDLAGKSMRFHVALKELREKQVPPLDDEFARSVSPHTTLGELRAEVRAELERASRHESDRLVHELMIDRILAANDVPVPPSLEARYLQAILRDFERNAGQPLDDAAREQLWERYRPAAHRAVQRLFVLEQLRQVEGLAVGDEELQERIAELAASRKVTPDEMRRALQGSNSLERLRNDLVEDKVFALLTENATITVVERTAAEVPLRQAPDAGVGTGVDTGSDTRSNSRSDTRSAATAGAGSAVRPASSADGGTEGGPERERGLEAAGPLDARMRGADSAAA